MPAPEDVAALCAKAGFSPDAAQAELLASYLDLLMRWNARMNLVGARDWQSALSTLVIDSFWLARFLERGPHAQPEVWDLGAGAGLPGLPLRALWNAGTYWLVEAREKRALFLSTALARLRLPRTHVFRGRAEAFMRGKHADIILSRAFLPWRDVLALARPHLAPGGRVLLMTGEALPDAPEISGALWRRADALAYDVGGDKRYLASFSPDETPISAPS